MVRNEPSCHQRLDSECKRCLYYRDPRTRGEARGTTWIHQPVPVRRARKDPHRPTVNVHRASATSSTAFLVVRPGDRPRTIAASALMSSATRDGETRFSAPGVPGPSKHFPKPFLSPLTPVPQPFPPPLWPGAPAHSCSAPSVTTDRIAGPTASSSAMGRTWFPQPGRPLRIRTALNSNRCAWDAQT